MTGFCLVTGGAGFIGSHLVDSLVASGHKVRVFDDLSTGRTTNLPPSVELVRGCLTDPAAVAAAARGAEVVFHLGAMASVAQSLVDPARCHAVCASGTVNVLVAAKAAGVRRVVYSASSSAYGSASDSAGQDESTPLECLSPYAAAKLGGEFALQACANSLGVETVRLRFFNVFGPRQRADSPYSGVIAIFADKMLRGERPTVHGDGLQARDFTYVSNAVKALRLAADAPGASGKVFNVGTGKCVTLLELVAALNRVLGTKLEPQFGPARVGDVRFSRAKIDAIRAGLGFEPETTFDEGLSKTVAWYREGKP